MSSYSEAWLGWLVCPLSSASWACSCSSNSGYRIPGDITLLFRPSSGTAGTQGFSLLMAIHPLGLFPHNLHHELDCRGAAFSRMLQFPRWWNQKHQGLDTTLHAVTSVPLCRSRSGTNPAQSHRGGGTAQGDECREGLKMGAILSWSPREWMASALARPRCEVTGAF